MQARETATQKQNSKSRLNLFGCLYVDSPSPCQPRRTSRAHVVYASFTRLLSKHFEVQLLQLLAKHFGVELVEQTVEGLMEGLIWGQWRSYGASFNQATTVRLTLGKSATAHRVVSSRSLENDTKVSVLRTFSVLNCYFTQSHRGVF